MTALFGQFDLSTVSAVISIQIRSNYSYSICALGAVHVNHNKIFCEVRGVMIEWLETLRCIAEGWYSNPKRAGFRVKNFLRSHRSKWVPFLSQRREEEMSMALIFHKKRQLKNRFPRVIIFFQWRATLKLHGHTTMVFRHF